MGGAIVEQQTDQRPRRVMRIEALKEGDELARAMPLGHHVTYEAAHQIDRRGECKRAKPLARTVALHRGMVARFRRQVGGRGAIAWMPGFSS
jgi:hypothetical protein